MKNAADNGVTNADFILGDAVEKLPELIESGVRPDVIVLDPPRAGCSTRPEPAAANPSSQPSPKASRSASSTYRAIRQPWLATWPT